MTTVPRTAYSRLHWVTSSISKTKYISPTFDKASSDPQGEEGAFFVICPAIAAIETIATIATIKTIAAIATIKTIATILL